MTRGFIKAQVTGSPAPHLFSLPTSHHRGAPTPSPLPPSPLKHQLEGLKMSRKSTNSDDQLALVPIAPATAEFGTRHAEMLETALAAAREHGLLDPLDEALVSVARANARALDAAEAQGEKSCYAIANLTGPYREVLAELRMTPTNRKEEANDELNRALAELSAPSVRDA